MKSKHELESRFSAALAGLALDFNLPPSGAGALRGCQASATLACQVAASLIRCGRLDPEEVGARLARGDGYHRAGEEGPLVRCLPVGLFHFRRLSSLVADSVNCCLLTHPDPRAGFSAAALNLVLAGSLVGQARRALEYARIFMRYRHREVFLVLERVEDTPPGVLRTGYPVLDSLQAALWAHFRTRSFEEALQAARSIPELPREVCSIVAVLAGASYGLEAFPGEGPAALPRGQRLIRLGRLLFQAARTLPEGETLESTPLLDLQGKEQSP